MSAAPLSTPALEPTFPRLDGKPGLHAHPRPPRFPPPGWQTWPPATHPRPHSTHVSPPWTANLASTPTLDPRFPALDGKRWAHRHPADSTAATCHRDLAITTLCNMLHISKEAACLRYW